MSETTQLATRPTASSELAAFIGMEPRMMLDTFKAQCFRNANAVTDAQLASFVSIAREMKVNPLLPGMLYAYPTTGGGIVPMIGPDGVYKKLMEHPSVDSWETTVYPEDVTQAPTHAKTEIWLKGRERPISYTALMAEWKVGSNPNWNSRPRHMLALRSLKQAARQVIHGLPYDEDDRVIGDLVNVTGTAAEAAPEAEKPQRQAAPKRERGVAAAAAERKAQTATVEAEVLPPQQSKAEPTQAATEPAKQVDQAQAVDVAAEPVREQAQSTAAASEKKAEPAKQAAPVAEKKAPEAKVEPLTKLEDGQRVTFEGVEIFEFKKKVINKQESIEADLKGAYTGKVYHLGGANDSGWQIEKPVTVTLIGKKLTSGAVITLVEKLEISAVGESLELS